MCRLHSNIQTASKHPLLSSHKDLCSVAVDSHWASADATLSGASFRYSGLPPEMLLLLVFRYYRTQSPHCSTPFCSVLNISFFCAACIITYEYLYYINVWVYTVHIIWVISVIIYTTLCPLVLTVFISVTSSAWRRAGSRWWTRSWRRTRAANSTARCRSPRPTRTTRARSKCSSRWTRATASTRPSRIPSKSTWLVRVAFYFPYYIIALHTP